MWLIGWIWNHAIKGDHGMSVQCYIGGLISSPPTKAATYRPTKKKRQKRLQLRKSRTCHCYPHRTQFFICWSFLQKINFFLYFYSYFYIHIFILIHLFTGKSTRCKSTKDKWKRTKWKVNVRGQRSRSEVKVRIWVIKYHIKNHVY